MATRKPNAAEAELQKVEAQYVKLHPLASTGNDVSPITRGELRIILEDLLGQMGVAAPEPTQPEPPKVDPDAGFDLSAPDSPQLNLAGASELEGLSRKDMLAFAKTNGLDVSGLQDLPDEGLAKALAAMLNFKP